MQQKYYLIIGLIVIIGAIFISGCISQDTTMEGAGTTNKSQVSEAPTAEEYPNAALGGTFGTDDKVEYLGVKGTIVTGRIENGKVTLEPLQINDESGALVVYGSFDHPTYGHMAMAHYPKRGGGEGEYDLYDDGELVATMMVVKGYGRNAHVIAACEPDSFPEHTEAVLIKRLKECSSIA